MIGGFSSVSGDVLPVSKTRVVRSGRRRWYCVGGKDVETGIPIVSGLILRPGVKCRRTA